MGRGDAGGHPAVPLTERIMSSLPGPEPRGSLLGRWSSGSTSLPTGWSVTGQIDTQGKLVTSGDPITLPDIPWNVTGTVTASGILRLTFSAPSGSVDPASGSATLSATAYGVVTVSASLPLFGSYIGTCKLGTAANPISIPFSTASPGTPYSQTDGSLTLAAHVTAPPLTDCNPALPGTELANLLAESVTMQFSGTVNPIILAP